MGKVPNQANALFFDHVSGRVVGKEELVRR